MIKNSSWVIALFLGSTQAVTIRSMKENMGTVMCFDQQQNEISCSQAGPNDNQVILVNPDDELVQMEKYQEPATNHCVNANKATGVDQECTTPGNSAWNTYTTSRSADPVKAQDAPYPDHTLHVQLDKEQAPATNHCVNANKATGIDQECTTPGNSAWNTYTTSRSADPVKSQNAPYPDHTLHLQLDKEQAPATNHCVNANKATGIDQECTTPGNSAWNTYTTSRSADPVKSQNAPYPDHTLHIQLDKEQAPATNHCVNANKATGIDQECTTPGNSAWNTYTTSRSADPVKSQNAPYPDHTLHVQVDQSPATNICVNANKATGLDEECTTPGNSAWNTYTSARSADPVKAQNFPYPGHALHLQTEQAPATNICVNANKATGLDEECTTPGNSAWNTYTSARSADPVKAQNFPYPGHALHLQTEQAPATNICVNANKATGLDEECTTPGNSAWNTYTSARSADPVKAQNFPYPGHALHLMTDQEPATNFCVNANKATGLDEECTTPGNSAWNTYTSSRTMDPVKAQNFPYPGHALHLQTEELQEPATNFCVNANKATGLDEECTTPGNSAWNTYTSSRTMDPVKAQNYPYPGHALH